MNSDPSAFAAAARALVGSPFRLRGRDPATGIDCIGLVVCALAAIGRTPPRLPHYKLRNGAIAHLLKLVPEAGFYNTHGLPQTGDLVLLRPSSGQYHLAIAETNARIIHAHAGLGRVVVTPAPDLPSTAEHWRLR